MPTGIFRSEDGWAQVDYGTGTTIPIPRSRYEANGYKPDFDKLPSEAEYRAAEDKKEDDAKRRLKASSARRDRRRHEVDIVRERNFAQEASTITPDFSGLRLGASRRGDEPAGSRHRPRMPPGYLLTACGYRFDQSRTS